MKKKILLVEPAYKTKYPPLGLMKISTYHKMKGDEVRFVKGCDRRSCGEYWDRVYISTLFTYTWKETVKTINFYHNIFNEKIYVGGILASLLSEELFNATGIQPVFGLLDNPNKIDQDDDIIIDELSPDYEILRDVDFKYAYTDAYIGYATRGCIRKCKFCAVKKLEPEYISYVNVGKLIKEIKDRCGEKQNLLLMDNNVLASERFNEIIDDIKTAGFLKGSVFGKTKRRRIVDFNQGLDARLLTEEKMKKLAEINLDPMRLAFDDIKLKNVYVAAVRLAYKYGQKSMSNYILYNYEDTPDDFYERLKINIDLNEEFHCGNGAKTVIYSFPMRYIPTNAKNRNVETGNIHWNTRYLRGLKVILNVTKGPVMPGKQFFEQAFGRNPEEFKVILSMPEEFIRNRVKANWREIDDNTKRLMPYVKEWMEIYEKLSKDEKNKLIHILSENNLANPENSHKIISGNIKKLWERNLEAKTIVSKYKNGK